MAHSRLQTPGSAPGSQTLTQIVNWPSSGCWLLAGLDSTQAVVVPCNMQHARASLKSLNRGLGCPFKTTWNGAELRGESVGLAVMGDCAVYCGLWIVHCVCIVCIVGDVGWVGSWVGCVYLQLDISIHHSTTPLHQLHQLHQLHYHHHHHHLYAP